MGGILVMCELPLSPYWTGQAPDISLAWRGTPASALLWIPAPRLREGRPRGNYVEGSRNDGSLRLGYPLQSRYGGTPFNSPGEEAVGLDTRLRGYDGGPWHPLRSRCAGTPFNSPSEREREGLRFAKRGTSPCPLLKEGDFSSVAGVGDSLDRGDDVSLGVA